MELSSPNANNYLHIDSRYLSAFLTPSPSDVTMDSPSPIEIAASINVPDAVVLRRNMQNAVGDGLDVAREQFISSAIGNNVDNGNVKHVVKAAYPGQAKQIIASGTGIARIVDEVGPLDKPMAMSQPDSSPQEGHGVTVNDRDEAAIGQGEVSDFRSGIAHVDLDPNNDTAVTIELSFSSSSKLTLKDRRSASVADGKRESDVKSKEIVDVNIDSSRIVRTQPGPSSELVSKTIDGLLEDSVAKSKTEVGRREMSDPRCKADAADVDLSSKKDRPIATKTQSSSELRLGECCWPTRESAVNDSDNKMAPEKEIIDVRLDSGDTSALDERYRSTVDASNDEVSSDRVNFSNKNEPRKNYRLMTKDDVEDYIDADDVVKVQPLLSSRSVITLEKDHSKISTDRHTNDSVDEREAKHKDNIDLTAIDNTELTKNNLEITSDEVAAAGATVTSRKEIIDVDENSKTTSSANVWMTSLDGRHECALSDFSVDKEDYQLSRSDEDGREENGSACESMKHGQEQVATERADVGNHNTRKIDIPLCSGDVLADAMIDQKKVLECPATEKIDNSATSSEELSRSDFIAERSLPEIDNKINIENEEQTKASMIVPCDRTNRTEKRSEIDACSSEKMASSDQSFEIDGKYLKSIVNSRKSPRKMIRDDQTRDVEIENQSDVFRASSVQIKNCEKKEEKMTSADTEKKDQIMNDRKVLRAEKDFQDSSKLISTKPESLRNAMDFQNREDNRECKIQTGFSSDKELKTSRSNSTKTRKKVEDLQTDERELDLKNQDKSVSDHETSRSEKVSQKFSKTNAKSPKRDAKKNKIFSRSDEMRSYDRSINDRVISQLEEVFHDSLRESAKKTEDATSSEVEAKKQNQLIDNRERTRSEELSRHPSRTSSTKSLKKIQDQKSAKINDIKEQKQQERQVMEVAKNADNKTKGDFNEIKDVYTRKVRRYNVPLQGSLDSMIVSDELCAQKPKKDDAFSKKSKSYESIKRIQEVFLGVPSTKANNSDSQIDIPDEFCSICCYMNEITFRTEEEVSSNQETFYTLRSTCSSLGDDDSIECDICGPLNLQESADNLEDKVQEMPCELCRICDVVNGGYDQDSTLPADKYAFKIPESQQDDGDCFEIENCGFQGTVEPADDQNKACEKEKLKEKDQEKPASQSLFIRSSLSKDQPRELYFIPKDEIAILTSGTRKIGRKGSLFRKKEDFGGNVQDNRRYSSVDSLQLAKMAAKTSDKVLKVAEDPTVIGSADNLRISGDDKKPMSLQRSADDVGCLKSSADNLDSLAENQEKETEVEESGQKQNTRDKEAVKMILTQHGIKIISEKETAL